MAVNLEAHALKLLRALERAAPHERRPCSAPETRLLQRHGLATSSAAQAKRLATFLHRTGLMRLHDGAVELLLPDGAAEACLRTGTVALNATLLAALTDAQRAHLLLRETHHLPRALADDPGLTVEPQTASLLSGSPHFRAHRPAQLSAGFHALKAAAARAQPQGLPGAAPHCRRALSPQERPHALAILRFHQHADVRPQAPPLPPKPARLPPLVGLEAFATEADDAAFASWFLEQAHHHAPSGGADPTLRGLLTFSAFAGRLRIRTRALGPLHQGWPLHRHLAQSVLQLQTDALLHKLAPRHDARWRSQLRLCMRLAMLFHDTGKLLGPTPRRHSDVSARLFARFKPAWFPAHLVPLTQSLIRTHDVFGALCRSLTDKRGHPPADYAVELSLPSSYPSALDTQAARRLLLQTGLPLTEAAAIHRQLWSADVGSISSLRWLLPVATLLESLVLCSSRSSFAGLERRSA